MRFPGHVGAALLAYAPIGLAATARGSLALAVVGAGVTVALASLPDADHYVPRMTHRGYAHTVWFALVVGSVSAGGFAIAVGSVCPGGFAVAVAGRLAGPVAGLAAFGFVVGATAICSHVAVDALTPMGVAPFAPISRRRYGLDVTPSASPTANRAFLLAGVGATLLAFALGEWLR